MVLKGRVRFRQRKENNEWGGWSGWRPNLFVDDGKELTLDFLFGLLSWWNPKDQGDYVGGDSGWNTVRYVQVGDMMFNNQSFERGSGMKGIPSGSEYNYKIEDTFLVSPEDSFLSSPVGSRVVLDAERVDQHVHFRAIFDCPGDIPTGTQIREIGVFLRATGPINDPSQHEASKPYTMICRSSRFGTGYYNSEGATGQEGQEGYEPCFNDDPIFALSDTELEWEFGDVA